MVLPGDHASHISAFFDFKKVGRWDPTCLRYAYPDGPEGMALPLQSVRRPHAALASPLSLAAGGPVVRHGNALTRRYSYQVQQYLTKGTRHWISFRSYYRTKARGRLGCLAGNRGGGQAEAAAMVQALSEVRSRGTHGGSSSSCLRRSQR